MHTSMQTTIKSVATAALMALMAAGPALADPKADANAAHDRKDYAAEVAIVKPLAEKGEAWAQVRLGGLYDEGDGAPRDAVAARHWYRLAGDQGDQQGQALTASSCVSDVFNPPDDCRAIFAWFKARAEKGETRYQMLLSSAYEVGMFGVAKDPERAHFWLRSAAEQGDASAQDALAMRYEMGIGVAEDPQQALLWYGKAADQDAVMAESSLADWYENGRHAPPDPAKAFFWNLKVAQHGMAGAQRKVATAYALGKGVAQDYVQAYAWLDVAISGALARDGGDTDPTILARDGVAAHLDADQLAAAKRTAAELKVGLKP